ncbi:glutamate receptor ionotropic, kainate 4 isoform X2 [Nomia melanderi]|uniref:glutamate receptor ionotropic, kainate 4 isoform X2 n=1 Tax=Nomia melanderi TaxID=2448451 RepID=UPI003FCD8C61
MRLTVCLHLISLGMHLLMSESAKPDVYIPLLKHLRRYYSASAVVLVQPCPDGEVFNEFKMEYMVQTWVRNLGRENIATLTVPFAEMHSLSKYYNSIVRPIIVVMINGMGTFNELSNITRTFNMHASAWLILFAPLLRRPLLDYCYAPPGNPFHLSFNTEMAVLCPTEDVLHEWYSVDGRSTEISKLGKWRKDSPQNLELFTNLSLYERRANMKGTVLRAVTVESSILLEIKDNKLHGFLGTIINELEAALNFTVKLVSVEPEYGIFNTTTKRWGGAIGVVISKMADIGISDFSMVNDRPDYVDFTIPILATRQMLFLKQPEMFAAKWLAYYKAFSFSVWTCVLVTGIIGSVVTTFIVSRLKSCGMMQVMRDECLRVWGILCLQGLTDFPRISSLKLAYVSLFLSSYVASSAYSASLICFLTARIRDVPFRTVDEFITDGTFDIIAIKGSANYDMISRSTDSLSMSLMKLMKQYDDLPLDTSEGFQKVCTGNKLAFFMSYSPDMKEAVHSLAPCNTFMIPVGRVESLAMILTKNNPFTPFLNYHLQKLLSSGVLNREKNEKKFHEETEFLPVTFGGIISVFSVFILGAVAALLTLFAEICCDKYILKHD